MRHPSDVLLAHGVTSEAIQAHGGYGFTDEFPVSRF
jgi:alkylation response protein AidB-like acyl-CoA dehydrogenase